jgi:hypothetical protein
MEADLETLYDITEEKELTSEENVYVVPPKLFDPIKIYLTWESEKDSEKYPSFYVRISPNTWNQKTNTICSWMVNASEDDDEEKETIQLLKQEELMDYIYWIFQHIFYDSNPTDSNEILLPNLPSISLEPSKLKDELYMSNMADHVAEYVKFLTNHWPVRKSRLASESSPM